MSNTVCEAPLTESASPTPANGPASSACSTGLTPPLAAPGKTAIERFRQSISRFAAVFWVILAVATQPALGADSLTGRLLFVLGAGLTVLGAGGRSWCQVAIAGNKTRKLITDGPYSLCRNPLYVFSLLGAVGVGLATRTLTLPAITVVAFVLYYIGVIRSEERRLREIHGHAFDDYCRRVHPWLPGFSHYQRLDGMRELNARALSRGVADSCWFFVAFVGLTFLQELQKAGEFAHWLTLP